MGSKSVDRSVNIFCVNMKATTCIGENKDADQLYSNCTADQRLCFHYTDSTMPLLLFSFKLKPFQMVGLNWLKIMFTQDLNGILADEMVSS